MCTAESLAADEAIPDNCSSVLVSIVVPIILCCVAFTGIVVGVTAYIIVRRRRRWSNQKEYVDSI